MKSKAGLRIAAVLMTATLSLTACSEDKSPPDDGKARAMEMAKTSACADRAAFRECALLILSSMPMSRPDRDLLSSCDFGQDSAQAIPQSISIDEFEAARSSVMGMCL